MTREEALVEIEKLENERKDMKAELFRIGWYMRGFVSDDSIFYHEYENRAIMADIIKDNLKTTKDSGLPFF